MGDPSGSSSRSSASSPGLAAAGAGIAVTLHLASLDLDGDGLARLEATLSGEEHARAEKLAGDGPRRHFIADHGHRRALLAGAVGVTPERIAYVIDADGKPRLDGPGPHFSASRAGPVALYALCDEAEVGVDVESIPASADDDPLVRRLLSDRERAAWDALAPAASRAAALYACWTRKEAYGKALGTGLVFPLSRVEAWAGDDRPVRHGEVLMHTVDLTVAIAGRSLAAAVAVRGPEGAQVTISSPRSLARTLSSPERLR